MQTVVPILALSCVCLRYSKERPALVVCSAVHEPLWGHLMVSFNGMPRAQSI